MKIKAVCTDIDGTLLDSRRELSVRTIQTIKRIKDSVPVILASARMPAAMRHLQRELGIMDQPLICFNGGYVISYDGESTTPSVLDSVQMPLSVCTRIIGLAEGRGLHISLFANDEWYAATEDEWTEREARNTKVSPTILPFPEVIARWQSVGVGPHKVMCMGNEEEIARMYSVLSSTFGHDVHIYRSKSTFLEIAPGTVSKATALSLLMKNRFNTDLSGVIAFGDNYNDIDMLSSVGLGVAVGSARPEVIRVAKEVTLNSKDDGVAATLEKYFLP